MISCTECGHDCTKRDFEALRGLCDHLYLDALAALHKPTSHEPISGETDSTKQDCPRCQGLMRAEAFVDWTTNRTFAGWRCLSCGNVWDPGIADNRSTIHTQGKNYTPISAGLSLAMTTRSNRVEQQSRMGREPIRVSPWETFHIFPLAHQAGKENSYENE